MAIVAGVCHMVFFFLKYSDFLKFFFTFSN